MVAQVDKSYFMANPRKTLQRFLSYALFEGRPLTTSGSWINSFIFSHFAMEKRFPQLKRVEKPIFIIGAGRSGTTLLGIILSMHKDVGFLNEPKALWHTVHPYEDIIGSYSKIEGNFRLSREDATPEVIKTANKLFGAYLRIVSAQRIVDKYPELVFRVPFVHTIFQDSKFIFLTRNGYDTAASIQRWSERKQTIKNGNIYDWWGKNGRKWNLLVEQIVINDPDLGSMVELFREMTDHLVRGMTEWIVTMREGLKIIQQFPNDIFMLRYEDLTSDPDAMLEKVLCFCELPEDKIFTRFALSKIKSHRVYKRVRVPDILQPAFNHIMAELEYPLN